MHSLLPLVCSDCDLQFDSGTIQCTQCQSSLSPQIKIQLDSPQTILGQKLSGKVIYSCPQVSPVKDFYLNLVWRACGPKAKYDHVEIVTTVDFQKEGLLGVQGEFEFKIDLPIEPNPYEGEVVSIEWKLVAVLELKHQDKSVTDRWELKPTMGRGNSDDETLRDEAEKKFRRYQAKRSFKKTLWGLISFFFGVFVYWLVGLVGGLVLLGDAFKTREVSQFLSAGILLAGGGAGIYLKFLPDFKNALSIIRGYLQLELNPIPILTHPQQSFELEAKAKGVVELEWSLVLLEEADYIYHYSRRGENYKRKKRDVHYRSYLSEKLPPQGGRFRVTIPQDIPGSFRTDTRRLLWSLCLEAKDVRGMTLTRSWPLVVMPFLSP